MAQINPSTASQANVGWRGFVVLFEWRPAGGNKDEFVQTQFLDGRLGDQKMAEMNRIECAAK